MIGWLEGALRVKTPSRVVIVTGGVGYEACISLTTFTELPDEGKTVAMHVYTHVREDVLQLYGFASALERAVFELLLRTSGVGPRLALAILSGLEPHALLESISKGAVARLRADPGRRSEDGGAHRGRASRAGRGAREGAVDESASSGDSPLRGTPIVPPGGGRLGARQPRLSARAGAATGRRGEPSSVRMPASSSG